ncbi:MAG: dTDP-4-dehydrorhamnose reductase [Candidatus Marinimicrobia bacterium]|nr:dTDP-4-dehydrorhamnose reductase [Candidatus Neomarinimicrobiota bacterium]|tara:strand:- start:116 stop:967 length:852 start_codon:yes stop_codon:yes gene_type:complete
MKKVLITGSGGILGSELSNRLNELFDVLALPKSSRNNFLDITDFDMMYSIFKNFEPDFVINCAAFTNVDSCESNKQIARNVNVKGLMNLLKCMSKNSKMIHISSDYVFDGKNGNYKENDMKEPINYYGKTKLEADNLLMGSNSNYLIIRPNVLYSSNLNENHFLSWVVNSLKEKNEINVVNDQISNPVYVTDLVEVILSSLFVEYNGVYHFGSEDVISRYDFALLISRIFRLDRNLINPIKTSSLKQVAKRPKKSFLNCNKIVNDLKIDLYSSEYSLMRIYNS